MADPNEPTPTNAVADTASANRARMQGLGSGQSELNAQRDSSRFQAATAPEQRSFDRDLDGATNADRPSEADFGGADGAVAEAETAERRDGWGLDPNLGRDEAGIGSVEGDLGAGTPANVDIHKLGQDDKPEQDWGEAGDAEAVFSSNNTRRGVRVEAERGQGEKTRRANKDIISRRG
jgi:hypothetical protein